MSRRPSILGIVAATIGMLSLEVPQELAVLDGRRRDRERHRNYDDISMNGSGLHDGPCPAQFAARNAAGRAKHRARTRGHRK